MILQLWLPGTHVRVVRTCPKTGTRVARVETILRRGPAHLRLSDGSIWPVPVPGADRVHHPDYQTIHLELP